MVEMAGVRPDVQVDQVLASLVDQRGDLPAVEIVEAAAGEREALRLEVLDRRGEIQAPVKPRLDGVLVGGHYVHQVAGLQRPDVIGDHRFGQFAGARQDDRQGEAGGQGEAAPKGAAAPNRMPGMRATRRDGQRWQGP